MKSKNLRYVVFASLVAALGGFLFGFDTAVISGAEKSVQEVFNLDGFWHGFTVAIALIGTTFTFPPQEGQVGIFLVVVKILFIYFREIGDLHFKHLIL